MRIPVAVGHLDADCFYVSAERVRDPFLVGKAVGVLGNQGACVIAKSYEMREAGVKVGEPIWEALAKCPEGIYVKRDFHWYEVLSQEIRKLVGEMSHRVEFYSIDEFFFVATPLRGRTYQETAEILRDRIWNALRVPVTVGIARTRTLAKLVSDAAKPFGALAVLGKSAEHQLMADLPVTEIAGIAGRRANRLRLRNVETCLDLAKADRGTIRQVLTASGEVLWWELNGEAVQPIHPARPAHKTLSRGGSLGRATTDPGVLYAWLVRNLERLIEELEYHQVLAGRLTVWVNYKDGRSAAGEVKLPFPTDRFDLLLDAGRPCLRSAYIPRVPAVRMQVLAERLTPRGRAQIGLFDPPEAADRARAVAALKHNVNDRHGRFALRSAVTLAINSLYQDIANDYDICDIRNKGCF